MVLDQESPYRFRTDDQREAKTYRSSMTPLRSLITGAAYKLFLLIANFQIDGAHHIPAVGPLILASNHLNNFDVFPLQFNFPRPIFFMAKAELFRNPLLDIVYRELGAFPVFRGERDDWAMKHAEHLLRQGLVLGMFPEGTRSREQGLRPAKTGAARLAIELGCPILPVAQYGSQNLLRRFPRRALVRVSFGSIIRPAPHESALALTDRLMFALAEMLPAEARGVYTIHPKGF